jgi:hypothetical protein
VRVAARRFLLMKAVWCENVADWSVERPRLELEMFGGGHSGGAHSSTIELGAGGEECA